MEIEVLIILVKYLIVLRCDFENYGKEVGFVI